MEDRDRMLAQLSKDSTSRYAGIYKFLQELGDTYFLDNSSPKPDVTEVQKRIFKLTRTAMNLRLQK